MTKQLKERPPTRRINYLIHTKVLGWERFMWWAGSPKKSYGEWRWRREMGFRIPGSPLLWRFLKYDEVPNYALDMGAAMEVVHHFEGEGTQRGLVNCRGRYYTWSLYWHGVKGEGTDVNLATAICVAALRAKRIIPGGQKP